MDVLWCCPTPPDVNCSWSGRDTEVLPHFQNFHKDLLLSTNSFRVDITESGLRHILLHYNQEIYLLQLEINPRTLLLKLRYLGTKEMAENFFYNAEVTIGEFSFRYLPKESFNCVYFAKGGIEVDIQTIKITVGQNKLEELTCFLDIRQKQTNKPQNEDNEIPIKPPSPLPEIPQTPSTGLSQKSDEEDDHCEDFLRELPLKSTFASSSNGSIRSSFLRNFFWEESNEDTSYNLECTNCSLEMSPPIYLCENNHSICNSCKLEKCISCGTKVTNNRNGDLEEISKRMKHACRFAPYGCLERYRYDEVKMHELTCRFCIYKCCLCGSFDGKFEDFRSHLKVFHSSTRISESMRNKILRNSSFAVVNRENGIFICNSAVRGVSIEWNVSFCGPKERWFSCELRLKGRKGDVSYFLRREQNHYGLVLFLSDLKAFNVKDKYAELIISSY